MNPTEIVLCLVIGILFTLALVRTVKKKGKSCSSLCGGDCSACHAACGKKE